MRLPETSIENLRSLGYTEDEARFLYLVATHSGYFSARQYLGFTGAKSGEKNMAFTQKVLGKGHGTARLLFRNGRVYHVSSRLIYRAIGRENLRNRREHAVEHIRTKLAILDFVLAHLDYRYLETEPEKVEYFCRDLRIDKNLLPAKRYAGAIHKQSTDRYFVDKFPLFFIPDSSPSTVPTFSFVDPGLLSLASFESHLLAYANLLSALPTIRFAYIATRAAHFESARKLFLAMVPQTTNPDPGVEMLRYFTYRHMWETKEYSRLNIEQIEFLNDAEKRFKNALTETRYREFIAGRITAGAVTQEFRSLAPKREASFQTELVDGQVALFEPHLPCRLSEVKQDQQSTFGSVFKRAFGTRMSN